MNKFFALLFQISSWQHCRPESSQPRQSKGKNRKSSFIKEKISTLKLTLCLGVSNAHHFLDPADDLHHPHHNHHHVRLPCHLRVGLSSSLLQKSSLFKNMSYTGSCSTRQDDRSMEKPRLEQISRLDWKYTF
jgi:hypothetical protein